LAAKIKNGEVKTVDIANDAIKPTVHIVQSDEITLSPGDGLNSGVDCPAGEFVTGGGLRITQNLIVRVHSSLPQDENTWSVEAINDGPGDSAVTLYAVCIGPNP
jgi:hypothetical protein